ncbi:MAG TPA: CoA transferase [Acidimicrobiales bacterium]|nr:CoA transferase [Acidimicrobiales bacterium]
MTRVLEATEGIAGAYCAKLLADAGCEVTILEGSDGHPLRRRRPAPEAAPGALFEFLSEGKAITADPGSSYDVVLVDGPPTGATPAAPITVSFSPFGLDGPWADRPATEFTIQAMCGSTGKRIVAGRPPVYAGGSPVEFVAGSYAAAAVSCLGWADETVHLDVSLLEAGAVTMQAFTTIDASFRGFRPTRQILVPSIEPAADGYVGFSCITAQQFIDFMHMVERPDMAADTSLLQPDERRRRADEVLAAAHAWTTRRTVDEIIEVATAYRIPVAPIGNGANLPERDHFVARGVFRRTPDGLTAPRRPYLITRSSEASPGGRWAGPTEAARPLSGLRVADFSAFWAGPSATHLLAALGADVVKVESTVYPDGMRLNSSRPNEENWMEWGAVFYGVNANKRSLTLDLRRPSDQDKAMALVAWADVVTENFSPRVLDDLGLGYERMSQVNPSAVLVRMPAFGLDGPWRDRTGFAMTVEQASGQAWMTGYADGPPIDVGGVCDPLCGMHAVVALMAALRQRAVDGCGALVEVPLVEVALNVAAEPVLQYSLDKVLLSRDGNHGPEGSPQGVYAARGDEAWVALSVRSDAERDALRRLIGGAGADLDAHIAEWTAGLGPAEAVEALVAAGIPAAEVVPAPVVEDNVQLQARGFFEELDHPIVGRHGIPSLPFRLVGRPFGWYRTPPPTLGQHNEEIERTILEAR